MTTEALGDQTVTVKARTRLKHGQWSDGPGTDYDGCSVQPMGSVELQQLGVTGSSRWNLFAPEGFPISSDNVIVWTDPSGRELTLDVDGELQPWVDEYSGTVEYVGGVLKKWTA